MSDLIDRQAAKNKKVYSEERHEYVVPVAELDWLPSAQPDARLKKIADLVDGTIDHFDGDDAMDLLYQIKEVLKNE